MDVDPLRIGSCPPSVKRSAPFIVAITQHQNSGRAKAIEMKYNVFFIQYLVQKEAQSISSMVMWRCDMALSYTSITLLLLHFFTVLSVEHSFPVLREIHSYIIKHDSAGASSCNDLYHWMSINKNNHER